MAKSIDIYIIFINLLLDIKTSILKKKLYITEQNSFANQKKLKYD